MQALVKPDQTKAIELWNKLALTHSTNLSIAHNPSLFAFYTDYLKLTPYYCILYNNQKPIGLLPLVLAGNKMISMPHFSHGGVVRLAREIVALDDESLIKLVDHLLLIKKPEAGFYEVHLDQLNENEKLTNHSLEIRQTKPLFENHASEKVLHNISLEKTSEEQSKAYRSNLRRKINKAEKNGIIVKTGSTELISDFAIVYNKNMHQLGSPTLGEGFFRALCQTLKPNAEVAVAYLNGEPVGGGFCTWYDGYFENTWFSTLPEFNHLYTSYALHDKMIKSAIDKNATVYSMGRSSKESGVQQYKLQWPVEEKTLYFNTNLESGFSLKDQKWLTSVWKLLPGFVVNSLGPVVAKKIY